MGIQNSQTQRARETSRRGEAFETFISPKGVPTEVSSAVWKDLQPELPQILERFYDAIGSIPPLKEKLGASPDKIERLKSAQVDHWNYIFTHPLDLEFEARSHKVGEAHLRTALTPQWYFAAYGRMLNETIPEIVSQHRFSQAKLSEALQTLVSRVFLDMIFAYGAYESGAQDVFVNDTAKENDLMSLRNLANTLANVNEVTLSLAFLSQNTRTSTESSQSIASSTEELVASIEAIANTSNEIAEDSQATRTAASEGVSAMRGVLTKMGDIVTRSEDSLKSVDQLNEATSQIREFLDVIESISSQTNLLALNATIEAARAGDAGKGFAVVASEVKGLATQAAKATEDISQRIQALETGMATIQKTILDSNEAVTSGKDQIEHVNDQVEAIGSQIGQVSDKIQDVSSILHEQKIASHEISSNISTLADLAKENSNHLDEISDSLQRSNDKFVDSAKTWYRDDSMRSLCEMAKIDHVVFKKRVVDTIAGRENWHAEDVPDHHNCRLGKWYDAVALPELRNHPEFEKILDPHKRVHEAARSTLTAHAAGRRADALEKLKVFENASIEVLDSLNRFSDILGTELKDVDRRGSGRKAMESAATLSDKNGERQVKIIDKSKHGLKIVSDAPLERGVPVRISYDGQDYIGETVWTDGNTSGLRLLREMKD